MLPSSTPPSVPVGTASPYSEATAARPFLATILSLVLLLFLGSAVVSLVDHSQILFSQQYSLSVLNGLVTLPLIAVSAALFGLMAFIPAIPRRIFVPLCLFLPLAYVAVLPVLVYFHHQADLIVWVISCCQFLFALVLLRAAGGSWSFRWPLFSPTQFHHNRQPGLGNFLGYWLATFLLLLPAIALYTGLSAQLAVRHFSDGFVILRPSGISMEVRKYVRDDGRQITLVPMSHVGEADFYQSIAESFPPDSMILMEGVSDDRKLMSTHLDYSRMAAATGGVPQVHAFKPRGRMIGADIDMSSFAPETLELLKNAMLVHSKGITPETVSALMKPAPAGIEKLLMHDLLTKRNEHLLGVIQRCLAEPGEIIVPWGAAHMPEIAREIHKAGFRLTESKQFVAIRFGS